MPLPSAVWLLIDGLSHELLTLLSSYSTSSVLQQCIAAKRVVPLRPLAPNCQTPPSLFTIWSGTAPAEHGMTGYDIPFQQGADPTQFQDGFSAWPRAIPMVWDRYAAAGKKIRTTSVPFMQIEQLGSALLSATDVFAPAILPPAILAHGDVLRLPELALEVQVQAQGETFCLCDQHGQHVQIRLGESAAFVLPETDNPKNANTSNHAIRFHAALIDGEPKLINLGYRPVTVYGSDAASRLTHGRSNSFVASNPGKLYQDALLGRRLDDGGSGAAETLLVDLMYEVHCSFAEDFLWSLQAGNADLIVAYYPVVDLLSHQILRYAVSEGDQRQAGPLAGLFSRVLTWIAKMLTDAAKNVSPQTKFIAHSDHGMSPIYQQIAPNRFFLEQGLLYLSASNQIDWQRSLMFMHPAENGLLVSHPQRMREAGVDQQEIMSRLAAVLREYAVDAPVLIVGPRAKLEQQWDCTHYIQAPRGTRLRATTNDPLVCRSKKGGDHTIYSDDPWLRGVLIDMSHDFLPFDDTNILDLAAIMPYVLEKRVPVC